MLETRPQSVDRAARSAVPPRPASRLASSAAPAARPLPARTPLAPRTAARRPTEQRRARPVSLEQIQSRRLSRSEGRLLTGAVTCVFVVCGLLVLYLAAYAHVTLLGIDQAKMRTSVREKQLENEMLRAQLASMRNPDRIAARAEALGLTRDAKRVDYIASPRTPGLPTRAVASSGNGPTESAVTTNGGGKAGPQVADNGTTTDDNSTARHD